MLELIENVKGELEEHDLEEVRSVLKNTSLLKVLREVLYEARDKAAALATMDLTTAEGLNKAVKQQGQIVGLHRALEIIMEKCNG